MEPRAARRRTSIAWSRRAASAGAKDITRAKSEAERDTIWSVRRQTSVALKATGLVKINHDVVVPRGRVPELFDVIAEMKRTYNLRVASFGHAGDGNIHVNLLLKPGDADEAARAKQAERFPSRASLHWRARSAANTGSDSRRPPPAAGAVGRRDRADETRQGRASIRTAS